MTQEVLSPAFWETIAGRGRRIPVALVEREAQELAVAAIFARSGESVVWLAGENEALAEKKEKLRQWLKFFGVEEAPVHVHLLPFEDPYINTAADTRKIAAVQQLRADIGAGKKMIVLTTLAALSIRVEPPAAAGDGALELRAGDLWERNDLIARLNELGYQARPAVEIGGDVSWRGNVVDVFPVADELPVRLEFEGRLLLSLRTFDLDSQRSTGTVAAARVGRNRYFSGPGRRRRRLAGAARALRLADRAAPRLPAAGPEFPEARGASSTSCWRISAASATRWRTSAARRRRWRPSSPSPTPGSGWSTSWTSPPTRRARPRSAPGRRRSPRSTGPTWSC